MAVTDERYRPGWARSGRERESVGQNSSGGKRRILKNDDGPPEIGMERVERLEPPSVLGSELHDVDL